MPAPGSRVPFHLLRTGALSTGVLTLAAGAHLAGGGALPAPGIMLAILALTLLTSAAATRLRLGLPAMVALLGSGQVVLHTVFHNLSAPMGPSSTLASGHDHQPAAALQAYSDSIPLGDQLHAGETSPLMLVAHILATAACALLLAKGEDALWTLAAWLRPLAALPRSVVLDAVPTVRAFSLPAGLPRQPWRNLRQHSRRGPPSAVVRLA